jgi:hypothetical protein
MSEMSETVEQAWDEPETIRRTMLWSYEIEKAVAEEAQKISSTPIEVISELVQEGLEHKGYHFNGSGNGNGSDPEMAAQPSPAETEAV